MIANPKFLRQSEDRLRKLQKDLSRTKKGNKNRIKCRIKVAKQHEKIANQRKDFLNKLSKRLINENQVIALEDIRRIKGFMIHYLNEQGEAGKSYLFYQDLMQALYDTLGFVPEDVVNSTAKNMIIMQS